MRKGFTLIELIIVVGVLSIAAAAAYPALSGGGEIAIDAAAKLVKSDMQRTRLAAMTKGAPGSAVFTQGASAYVYDGATEGLARDLADTAPGLTIADGVTITFNTLGEPVSGAAAVVLSCQGMTRRVIVEAYTGAAYVQ